MFLVPVLVCPPLIKKVYLIRSVAFSRGLCGRRRGESPLSAFPEFPPLMAFDGLVIGFAADLRVTSGSPLHALIARGRSFLAIRRQI